jgi:hypothetical protein
MQFDAIVVISSKSGNPVTPLSRHRAFYRYRQIDNLDRLTSAVKSGTTQGWPYDANGNRLTETGTSVALHV